ncbi:MAG UNVERIFIED_CONTAM: hypothetical protein LVR29_19185 [Microcystis novacekii LVE1205-3]
MAHELTHVRNRDTLTQAVAGHRCWGDFLPRQNAELWFPVCWQFSPSSRGQIPSVYYLPSFWPPCRHC